MIDVLFSGELIMVAAVWQVWESLVVSVVLFMLELTVVGGWSVKVVWVNGDSVGGDVLLVVMGAVAWLEWGPVGWWTSLEGGRGAGRLGGGCWRLV